MPSPAAKVEDAFLRVRAFVSTRFPYLRYVDLNLGCPEIADYRRGGRDLEHRRAVAHVKHIPHVLCAIPALGNLAEGYRIGVMLHEFGHIGSKEGKWEDAADLWALRHFGVPIAYKGPLILEHVDTAVIREKGI